LLGDLYNKADLIYQKELSSIIQKLWCNMASLDTSLFESTNQKTNTLSSKDKQYRNISVFWTLWWILFFIAFSLKIHYIISYKKQKKRNTKGRTPKE
jgi:hypothetical protein